MSDTTIACQLVFDVPCGDARAGLNIGLAARRRRDTLALVKAVNESDAGSRLGALHCRLEHESPVLDRPRWLPGQPCPLPPGKEDEVEQTEEPVELVERVVRSTSARPV